jgi:NAD(P)-dependent dehydrogenase (short-subunit alcohol dehydrogenase family)
VIASASDSFHVVMTGRNLSKVDAAKSEIAASGIKGVISTLQLDVTDDESISKAAVLVEKKFGRLDVLVNNAGVAMGDPDLRTRYRKTFDTNVLGPALVADAFRPLLLKSEKPYSIYVSSIVGSSTMAADPNSRTYHSPYKNAWTYRASKSALNMIAILEAVDFRDTKLKVFALCPGLVVTGLRGKSEPAKTAGGAAESPEVSGRAILDVILGKRDADAGGFIHGAGSWGGVVQADGVYPW